MNIFKEIKWFIQRGRRGWADCDVWDFDSYLSAIIQEGVTKLKKDHSGVPMKLGDTPEKWDEILQEIIDGFEAYRKASENHYHPSEGEGKALYKKFYRAMDLFEEYFGSLWN